MESPFLDAIVDRLCDSDKTTKTSSYEQDVKFMYEIHQYGRRPGCTKVEIQELRKMIIHIKEIRLHVFVRYQS